jgi:hypothetical protein
MSWPDRDKVISIFWVESWLFSCAGRVAQGISMSEPYIKVRILPHPFTGGVAIGVPIKMAQARCFVTLGG